MTMIEYAANLHRIVRSALMLVALILGLLGMHILGVDHHMPHTTHLMPAVAIEQNSGPHGVPSITQHTISAAAQTAPKDFGGPAIENQASSLSGFESALIGLCVLGLAVGMYYFHLRAKASRPTPGLGLAAPPWLWVPRPRTHPRPSLVQLSISRT